ncbi:MAG TPA: hypothetical protein VGP18_03955 [Solirubrobacteraceae bacterium]|nr:hypothetical protein [Solirubrobacteraceae bacterium]
MSAPPWTLALAVALPLAVAYLILAPPAGDLAAATYRSDLFARVGFSTWDTGWYSAHGYWLPSYSLLSPALGALLGVRLLLALSALAASALFALIAERAFDSAAARIAAAWFALGFGIGLLSGRVPYDLGFALGLAAVYALMCNALATALALAVLTSFASPVAGAFLGLAGLAMALGDLQVVRARGTALSLPHMEGSPRAGDSPSRRYTASNRARWAAPGEPSAQGDSWRSVALWRGVALCAAALIPVLALGIAYPDGGYEPFAASAFWPALAGVLLIGLLLPQGPLTVRGRSMLRVGAALYALALIGAYAIHTPAGGNVTRLGTLLAAPLLAGVLWEKQRVALLVLAPLLLYWQLATPVRDYSSIAGDPSVHTSYYAPVLTELQRLRRGRPTIVEVPMTAAHWESAYLAGHDGVELARGWERQLDTRYAAIFYRKTLSPQAYRAWLAENRVVYVALPDAPLDKAGSLEGKLVAHGLPYLRELWHSEHWRLYRVMG